MGKEQTDQEELQAQMEEFNTKINALQAKVDTAEGSSGKVGYHDKLEALVQKRDQTSSKLKELQKGADGS